MLEFIKKFFRSDPTTQYNQDIQDFTDMMLLKGIIQREDEGTLTNRLSQEGANPNCTITEQNTPFTKETVLSQYYTTFGFTPMHVAVLWNNSPAIQVLAKYGANIDSMKEYYNLYYNIFLYRNWDLMKEVGNIGAKYFVDLLILQKNTSTTPLGLAARVENNKELIKLLLENGAQQDLVDPILLQSHATETTKHHLKIAKQIALITDLLSDNKNATNIIFQRYLHHNNLVEENKDFAQKVFANYTSEPYNTEKFQDTEVIGEHFTIKSEVQI
ncbi:hypothetical protein [Candidatus Tisiphia endosymbiont of Nemotelus uliginosus]|uniref:hypothetical protein n=1 Tax=Candidatus Tisiphia endosymbiont of Nemotelus uliginosus TaxID=3077926 RepID=UPI0035C8F553